MNARSSIWLIGALVVLCGACRSRDSAPRRAASATATASASVRVPVPSRSRPAAPTGPKPLLFLPVSAYQASLAVDDEAVYVLTQSAVHRIVAGQSTQTFPRELGVGAVLTGHGIAFWSKGKLFEAPTAGGDARELGAVPRPPQRLAASRDHLAWIDASETRKFSIHTLDVNQPRELYTSPGALDALALLDDDVFFVERLSAKSWRIGRVAAEGGEPRFTSEKRGRSPAQLGAFGDALYFQDSSGYKVMELSRDLEHERVLARDVVCSPLAVWERVYCAQVEGLVEVADGRQPRLLAPNARGFITAVAASSTAIAWLSDAGPNELTVKMLPREQP